jgi:hypothetical protein
VPVIDAKNMHYLSIRSNAAIRARSHAVPSTLFDQSEVSMIKKNLSSIERWLRLAVGLLLGGWAVSRPELDAVAWAGVVASLFLVLNAVFGRCYLWHVLEISSCGCNNIPANRVCDKPAA